MLTIHKFQILPEGTTIDLPEGARVLDVQCQRGEPMMWALLDDSLPRSTVGVQVRGTGHDCTGLDDWTHVGTFQLSGGSLVFHVFVPRGLRPAH